MKTIALNNIIDTNEMNFQKYFDSMFTESNDNHSHDTRHKSLLYKLPTRQAPSGYVYIIIIIIIIIINFYYCHYNWYHYCIYYDMFIDTITFTKYISYVSEIAQVRYTLTWCLPFDSDGISSDLLYD